jgi:hypothetical protein
MISAFAEGGATMTDRSPFLRLGSWKSAMGNFVIMHSTPISLCREAEIYFKSRERFAGQSREIKVGLKRDRKKGRERERELKNKIESGHAGDTTRS